MSRSVAIEDIDDMRRRAGIDDVELWHAIRGLRAGDCVRLTLMGAGDSLAGETLRVRITRIRGRDYRGMLADKPTAQGLSLLHIGSPISFTASQIHSLAEGPVPRRQ